MSKNSVVSIDLAKNVFQVCLINEHNKIIFNKKIRRKNLVQSVLKLDCKHIVMEACYSSNYWGEPFSNWGIALT